MLLIFAWSSVMLNCYPVYDRVTGAVFDYTWATGQSKATATREGDHPPKLDWRAAQDVGTRLMAEQAALHGFTVERAEALAFVPVEGAYYYSAKTSRDVSDVVGTTVVFDGDTGAFRSLRLPTGEHSGNTVTSWLYALHTAEVFGLPYRMFVCALGIAITILSLTGIYIWRKKLGMRILTRKRRRLVETRAATPK